MKIPTLAILLIIIGSITVGTSYAVIVHNDNVNTFGQLNVIDGNLVIVRDDGADSGIAVRNTGKAGVFQFHDVDDNQVYRFRLTADGSQFDFFDATHNRLDIVVKTATGNIGIGIANPQERLDVDGNLRLTGNIVSPNDICIGNCP